MAMIDMRMSSENEGSMLGGDEVVRDVGYSAEGLADKEGPGDGPDYPYCLKLMLDGDVLKKLGFEQLPQIGSTMDLQAKVLIVGGFQDADGDKSLHIQITEMQLGSEKAEKPTETMLYDGA